MINEHDMTRKMIDTMKDGRNLIREFITNDQAAARDNQKNQSVDIDGEEQNGEEQNIPSEPNKSSDDVIQLPQSEREPFETQFQQIIDESAQFTVFNVYPKARNVVFGGVIQGMGGIEFQLTLEDNNGVYITGNNIQITKQFVEQLNKMTGFYAQFRKDMFKMLDNDYKDR